MRICFATSECVPFVKTGGLADVSGALPKALAKAGNEVKVFLPLYGSINTIDHGLSFSEDIRDIQVRIGDRYLTFYTWYKNDDSGVEYHFIDCPHYFHRDKIYTDDPDEDERFFLFQDAVVAVLQRYGWAPDIMHCNDWQTALLPVYLKEKYHWDGLFNRTASVISIHNIGYQGRFSEKSIYNAGLKYDHYTPTGPFEFHNSFSTLKAGIVFADMVTTVSDTYAHEIQTPEFGSDLDGVLRTRSHDLAGILNGIDDEIWNPRLDKLIKKNYTFETIEDKAVNKKALLETVGLPYDENTPVIGIITRLAIQKGIELLQPILADLVQRPVQFVLLGSGEAKYEDFFRWATDAYPDKVSAYIGFNNELAHLIEAGSDMFLMPSQYEPCGLNQMYSLNYGTIPIVRKTGGLADTVRDYHEHNTLGNGVSFEDFTPYALQVTILRALELWHDKDIRMKMIERGMKEDFSWGHSAQKYMEVYETARYKRGF